ncbi:MAG: phasin family protein [Methyloligellaceae bacterium]
MNQQFTKQAEEFLRAAQVHKIDVPEEVKAAAVDGLVKTRETYEKLTGAAQDAHKAYDSVFAVAQNGAKVLSDRLLENSEKNAQAALEAAKALVRCKDLSEIAQTQMDFLQTHVATAGEQTREICELSATVAKETAEAANAAATQSIEQLKTSA